QLRQRRLHPKSKFVLADARLNFRVHPLLSQDAVEAIDFFDDLPLRALAHAWRIADVMDRFALGLKEYPLKLARQEPARPLPRRNRLQTRLAARSQHNETRQIVRLRAQPVEHP